MRAKQATILSRIFRTPIIIIFRTSINLTPVLNSRFPEDVKKVIVRTLGKERILTPVDSTWGSFFLAKEGVSDDFMTARASQEQAERETFDD